MQDAGAKAGGLYMAAATGKLAYSAAIESMRHLKSFYNIGDVFLVGVLDGLMQEQSVIRLSGGKLDEVVNDVRASSSPTEELIKAYNMHYKKVKDADKVLVAGMGIENTFLQNPKRNDFALDRLAKAHILAGGKKVDKDLVDDIDKIRTVIKAISGTVMQNAFNMGKELGRNLKGTADGKLIQSEVRVLAFAKFTYEQLKNISFGIADIGLVAAAGVVDGAISSFITQSPVQRGLAQKAPAQQPQVQSPQAQQPPAQQSLVQQGQASSSSQPAVLEIIDDINKAYQASRNKFEKMNARLDDPKRGIGEEVSKKPHKAFNADKVHKTEIRVLALKENKDAIALMDKARSWIRAVQGVTSKNVYSITKAATSLFINAGASRWKKSMKKHTDFVNKHGGTGRGK